MARFKKKRPRTRKSVKHRGQGVARPKSLRDNLSPRAEQILGPAAPMGASLLRNHSFHPRPNSISPKVRIRPHREGPLFPSLYLLIHDLRFPGEASRQPPLLPMNSLSSCGLVILLRALPLVRGFSSQHPAAPSSIHLSHHAPGVA